MLRLFIAVDRPAELRDHVAGMMDHVRNARWVNVKQLHITLRFLGDRPEADLPGIQRRLASIRHEAFRLRLHGAGVFPEAREHSRPKPPKVLWLGIEPATELARLKSAVDAALSSGADDLGQNEKHDEKKTFSPHLTLARFSALPDRTLSDFLVRQLDYASTDWWVTDLHLYQSTLRREGAIHARLASYPLARPESGE
jgi:2'-5' RNA ligase